MGLTFQFRLNSRPLTFFNDTNLGIEVEFLRSENRPSKLYSEMFDLVAGAAAKPAKGRGVAKHGKGRLSGKRGRTDALRPLYRHSELHIIACICKRHV